MLVLTSYTEWHADATLLLPCSAHAARAAQRAVPAEPELLLRRSSSSRAPSWHRTTPAPPPRAARLALHGPAEVVGGGVLRGAKCREIFSQFSINQPREQGGFHSPQRR